MLQTGNPLPSAAWTVVTSIIDLLPKVKALEGHASFLSNRKLQEAVGWEHRTSWREYL